MTINFLWVGGYLNKLGKLGLKSFLDNDHEVAIWLYDKNCKNIPDGVIKKDASEILNPDKVFLYEGKGDCRKGSCGGFSDLFRFYLLYEIGGWYCDTDVTCFKNFKELNENEYVFRKNKNTIAVQNIIKSPAKCNFLQQCIIKTEEQINSNNDSWLKPVKIFSEVISELNLHQYILNESFFGVDDINYIRSILDLNFNKTKIKLPTHGIHWCNEAINTGYWGDGIRSNMEYPIPTTLYYKLLKKHNLL